MSLFKIPKPPRNIPMHEMETIIGGRKQGLTYTEIKAYIDQGRKMRGTFTGQGISTNTISRMIGPTHKVEYREETEKAWHIYALKMNRLGSLERVARQIKDPEERERFMKFATQQTTRSKGRQYELEVGYDAETDEYVVDSP